MNVLVGSDHASIIESNDTGGLSGLTLWLRAQADGITLTQADSGKLLTPADGGGEISLPASAVAGTEFGFACLDASSPITVRAQGLHRILLTGESGIAVTGDVSGSRLSLVYAGPNAWVGLASGPWRLNLP